MADVSDDFIKQFKADQEILLRSAAGNLGIPIALAEEMHGRDFEELVIILDHDGAMWVKKPRRKEAPTDVS